MLKTKQNDFKKKTKNKKAEIRKKIIIVHLQRYALEIFKGHLHMHKINRFWKDNQSIECYTYFCNQRSIFLVLFVFQTGPKKQWACYVRHIRLILNDRCCPSPRPLNGSSVGLYSLLLLQGNSDSFCCTASHLMDKWLTCTDIHVAGVKIQSSQKKKTETEINCRLSQGLYSLY